MSKIIQTVKELQTDRERMFKDKWNRFLINSLFYELCPPRKYEKVLYTLGSEDRALSDGRVAQSLYRLYLLEGDPVGFYFGDKYFYDYDHWLLVKESPRVKPNVIQWEEHLQAKLKSEAIQKIVQDSLDPSSTTRQASARFLAQEVWKRKPIGHRKPKDDMDKVASTIIDKTYKRMKQEGHVREKD